MESIRAREMERYGGTQKSRNEFVSHKIKIPVRTELRDEASLCESLSHRRMSTYAIIRDGEIFSTSKKRRKSEQREIMRASKAPWLALRRKNPPVPTAGSCRSIFESAAGHDTSSNSRTYAGFNHTKLQKY